MALKETISAELKEAMKARDQVRLDTLRSALSAFSYRKIEAGCELDDADQVEVVRKLVKQRTDSIAEFERGNRPELAAKESRERDILSALLPAQKSSDDIRPLVRAALEALPPEQRNVGAAMKAVMPRLRAEADGATIRQAVQEELRALPSA
ncbi:MAG: GatB/YqeY domain-containing protein [Candidatus Eremiobacteraeota bacterium]|nr:GatB/YqeY domain-containing protein [Candidatus Eremiobacteraeota bacterium]